MSDDLEMSEKKNLLGANGSEKSVVKSVEISVWIAEVKKASSPIAKIHFCSWFLCETEMSDPGANTHFHNFLHSLAFRLRVYLSRLSSPNFSHNSKLYDRQYNDTTSKMLRAGIFLALFSEKFFWHISWVCSPKLLDGEVNQPKLDVMNHLHQKGFGFLHLKPMLLAVLREC